MTHLAHSGAKIYLRRELSNIQPFIFTLISFALCGIRNAERAAREGAAARGGQMLIDAANRKRPQNKRRNEREKKYTGSLLKN
jgi:hypothetical protein